MKKCIFPVVIIMVLSGCSLFTPEVNPPEWLQGSWVSQNICLVQCEVTSDNIELKFSDCPDVLVFNQSLSNHVQIKDIQETDTSYSIIYTYEDYTIKDSWKYESDTSVVFSESDPDTEGDSWILIRN